MLLHVLDLVVQEQCWNAQGEAKNGYAAERNRHAHHALAPHRLEHEQTEDAVHEIEETNDILRRREIAPARLEDRGARRELGEQEDRQPDQAPPDYPAHALIIRGRLSPRPLDEESDDADGHDKADKDGKAPVSVRYPVGLQYVYSMNSARTIPMTGSKRSSHRHLRSGSLSGARKTKRMSAIYPTASAMALARFCDSNSSGRG